jgi:alanine dehydrogenase
MAIGLGAQVTIMDISLPRLTQIDNDFGPRLMTEVSTREHIAAHLPEADLVIGGVLIPGAGRAQADYPRHAFAHAPRFGDRRCGD